VHVDGLGVDSGAGVDVRPDSLQVGSAADPVVGLDVVDRDVVDVVNRDVVDRDRRRPSAAAVLHLDRVERRAAAVDALVTRRPDLTDAPTGPWLDAVAALVQGADGALGDHERARLLAARAVVLLTRDQEGARRAHEDATTAAALYERCRDVLPAATTHAVAALAAVRAGDVGQSLDHAVQALVAFGSLSDGQRDPDGEAGMAEMLGRLCQQFFDHERALQFYELALRALRNAPDGAVRARRVQVRIADLLLTTAGGSDGAALARVDGIARSVLAEAAPGSGAEHTGRRLLAGVLCADGRPGEARELLAGVSTPDGADDAEIGELALARARCLHAASRDSEALAELDHAEAAFAAAGDLARQISALELRSAVGEARGDLPAALRDARQLADLVWQRHRRQVGGFMDQVWSRAGVEGERRDLEAKARDLARFAEQDSLTSLANRRAMERFCTMLRPHEQICLVLVDVDHFKAVNDQHGHLVGDVVLREVASVLSGSVRAMDRVARWGGEEFLIALPGGSAVLGAEAASRLRRRVEEHPWPLHAPGLRLTVSAGVSAGPAGEFAGVLARADAAVYAAKRAGRNRVITS
jgi:diguanylate cyclase (GGDEF)-like protein